MRSMFRPSTAVAASVAALALAGCVVAPVEPGPYAGAYVAGAYGDPWYRPPATSEYGYLGYPDYYGYHGYGVPWFGASYGLSYHDGFRPYRGFAHRGAPYAGRPNGWPGANGGNAGRVSGGRFGGSDGFVRGGGAERGGSNRVR